jgi:hypothetical protein
VSAYRISSSSARITTIEVLPEEHVWVCKRLRAVHISRYLYSVILHSAARSASNPKYGRYHRLVDPERELPTFAGSVENASCNCDLNLDVPEDSRSPWPTPTHDADCMCLAESRVVCCGIGFLKYQINRQDRVTEDDDTPDPLRLCKRRVCIPKVVRWLTRDSLKPLASRYCSAAGEG